MLGFRVSVLSFSHKLLILVEGKKSQEKQVNCGQHCVPSQVQSDVTSTTIVSRVYSLKIRMIQDVTRK